MTARPKRFSSLTTEEIETELAAAHDKLTAPENERTPDVLAYVEQLEAELEAREGQVPPRPAGKSLAQLVLATEASLSPYSTVGVEVGAVEIPQATWETMLALARGEQPSSSSPAVAAHESTPKAKAGRKRGEKRA